MRPNALHLRFTGPGSPGREVAVAEVFADGKRMQSGALGGSWAIEASGLTAIPVPTARTYAVHLRFPGGDTFDATGELTAGAPTEIEIPTYPRPGSYTPHRGVRSFEPPKDLLDSVQFAIGPLLARHAGYEVKTHLDDVPRSTIGPQTIDLDDSLRKPELTRPRVEVRAPGPDASLEMSPHPDGWLVRFRAPAGWDSGARFFVIVRPEAGPTYVQSVPAAADGRQREPLEVLWSPAGGPSGTPREPIHVPTFAKDPLAAFLAAGDLGAAGVLASSAESALRDKYRDPYGAALGGYVLVQAQAVERLHGWCANLADNFSLPDGPILAAWEILLRSSDPAALASAGVYLQRAISRGPPLFTAGIRLLREGLLRTAGVFADPVLWSRWLERTRLWSRHVHPRSLLTLFELSGPASELDGFLGPP